MDLIYECQKSKYQSMQWCHSNLPRDKILNQTLSTWMIMSTVFWDQKVFFWWTLWNQEQQLGNTFKTEACTLELAIWEANIRNFVLIYDNALQHTAACTVLKIH